jgi:hypothetical protein
MKRDGQLVPFDADKISRGLFAAGESLGRPDAFLARELTDGIVHFLAAEDDGTPLTTARVAELTVKVVRELGHPALAEAFAAFGRQREEERPPVAAPGGEVVLSYPQGLALAEVLASCVRSYSLQSVYARDLVAAQADGLLTLTGLDHPSELEGCVLGPWPPESGASAGLADAVEAARHVAGRFVALDSPEYVLARSAGPDARTFTRELGVGLRISGLSAVVNLNANAPPLWDGELAGGPLFAGQPDGVVSERRTTLADELLNALREGFRGRVRVDWHLGGSDFAPEAQSRLERVALAASQGAPVVFVFDRPGRSVALAEGIDRDNPAALLTVGLHLPRLAGQAGVGGDPERFLKKLESLARLALSAGVQKRAFLRGQERTRADEAPEVPALSAGFLLERARLVVEPVGLEEVARTFTGSGLVAGGAGLEFGRQVVVRLRDVLRHDGRQTLMETCVDGPGSLTLSRDGEPATVRDQLRAAGKLHAAAGGGTLTLPLPDENRSDPVAVAECLRLAWQRSEVVRLRFVRQSAGR